MKKTVITAIAAMGVATAAYAVDTKSETSAAEPASETIIAQKLAQAPDMVFVKGLEMSAESGTAMGGPEFDDETAMASGIAPGTRSIVMSQSMTTFQPIERAGYPACSATVTDNCQQR